MILLLYHIFFGITITKYQIKCRKNVEKRKKDIDKTGQNIV